MVLFGDQRLFHGGQLNIQVELGQVEIRGEGLQHPAILVPLDGETARFVFPGHLVEVEQVGEDFLAGVHEGVLLEAGLGGRHDAMLGQLEPRLELQVGLGRGREQALLHQPARAHRAANDLGHALGLQKLHIQHQVEGVRGGGDLPESALAIVLLLPLEIAEQRASRRPVQAMLEHQRAQTARLRRHYLNAQHSRKALEQQLGALGRNHQVMLGGQARHQRQHGVRKGLIGKRGLAAELLIDHRAQAGIGHQLEAERLRGEASHFFVPATRLAGYRDQPHRDWLGTAAPCS